MDEFTFKDIITKGRLLAQSPSALKVLVDRKINEVVTFRGHFNYDADGNLAGGGTVTSLTDTVGRNKLAVAVTGLKLRANYLLVLMEKAPAALVKAVLFATKDTLIGTKFDDALEGFGGNDVIKAGLGNDAIDGGSGRDVMTGGRGNDTYFVDNGRDRVIEGRNGGVDAVATTVSYTLAAGSQVETLLVAPTVKAAKAVTLTGNALANALIGHAGTNTLSGGGGDDGLDGGKGKDALFGGAGNDTLVGGAGADALTGGAGADTFVIATPGEADTIADFEAGIDTIELAGAAFDAAAGALDPDAFHAGAAAEDAEDRIVYDQATGQLWFDADGAGAASPVLLAVVANRAALAHTEFLIA